MIAEPHAEFILTKSPHSYGDYMRAEQWKAEARSLSPEVLKPITLLAQGNDFDAIAGNLTKPGEQSLAAVDIKNRLLLLRGVLGVDSNRKALEILLERGDLKLDQLLPSDFDPSVFSKIKDEKDQKIVKGILEGADYPAIGFAMRSSETEIAERVKSIRGTIGAGNNFQIFVLGLGAKAARLEPDAFDFSVIFKPVDLEPDILDRSDLKAEGSSAGESGALNESVEPGVLSEDQKKILALFAMGYREFEIRVLLGMTETAAVKKSLSNILSVLGAKTYSHAVWKAADSDQISLQSLVPKDFDPGIINNLDSAESDFLRKFISTSLTGESLDISRDEFASFKKRITAKLNVERLIQAEVLYLEAARRDNGGEVSEKVNRYGAPKTSKSISVEKIMSMGIHRAAISDEAA